MPRRKNFRIKLARALALTVAAFGFGWVISAGASLGADRWLRPRLEEAVPGLRVNRVEAGIFFPRLILRGVEYRHGDARDSAVLAKVRAATIRIPLQNLWQKRWKLGLLTLDGLDVLVHEGDLHLPKAASSQEPSFFCEGLEARDATFTYRKDSPAGAAWIRLTSISAGSGPFGSGEGWEERSVFAEAKARLEKSGEVRLRVEARFSAPEPHVKVDLTLDGQHLSELNPYFEVEEGVSLSGQLMTSEAHVQIEGRRAEGVVHAKYENLGITFHPDRNHGGLSSLLYNLGVQIKVNKGNSQEPRKDREKGVVTARHEHESVVSWVLRTMREASMLVATD